MSSQKICPQCKKSFEGRDNKRYCTKLCQQRAFHESKAALDSTKPSPSTVSTPKVRATHHPKQSRDPSIDIETLRVQAAERMKRLEMEQRQSDIEYEMNREDRQFEKERERAKWDYEALQLQVAKLDSENIKLEAITKEQPAIEFQSKASEQVEEELSDLGIGTGTLLLLGIAGGLLAMAMSSSKQKDRPAKLPASKPVSSTLDAFADKIPVKGLLNLGS